VLILDVGTLLHAIRDGRRLVEAQGPFYGGMSAPLQGFLYDYRDVELGQVPPDVSWRVSRDAGQLNQFLGTWRVTGMPEAQSGYRFTALRSQIGIVTSLFWWLVPAVPGLTLVRDSPQLLHLPAEGVDALRVDNWPHQVVRVPTVHHGTLWITRCREHETVLEAASDALTVVIGHHQRRTRLHDVDGVLMPNFFGYADQHLPWFRGARVQGQRGKYRLGPALQHVRVGFHLMGVPDHRGQLSTRRTLALNGYLLAFITPPGDPMIPYAVMSFGASDRTSVW
jgi:hypothetical protein